jgi:hypothetical protein
MRQRRILRTLSPWNNSRALGPLVRIFAVLPGAYCLPNCRKWLQANCEHAPETFRSELVFCWGFNCQGLSSLATRRLGYAPGATPCCLILQIMNAPNGEDIPPLMVIWVIIVYIGLLNPALLSLLAFPEKYSKRPPHIVATPRSQESNTDH